MAQFCLRFAWAAALALPVLARAQVEGPVTVVVDMTPEGRQREHPTKEKPSYYLPVMRGYFELGDPVAGEKPPTDHEVVHAVAPELAKAGYLVAIGHEPDIVLDFSWGRITPTYDPNVKNAQQRQELVLGHTLLDVMPVESFGRAQFLAALKDPRYFIVVTAFDLEAWTKRHKQVILWKAKMSVPTNGIFLKDAIAPLARAGSTQFGVETENHPKMIAATPDGRVEVGTPTVVPPPATSPAAPSGKD